MLTAANEATLKAMVTTSTIDSTMKTLLIKLIDALAGYSPAAADGTVGLATDTLVGTTETITIKNGIITAIAANG